MRRVLKTLSLLWGVRAFGTLLLLCVLMICLSCAPSGYRFSKSSCVKESVLGVEHIRSKKPADCLASCVNMVLRYYGIEAIEPDTSLPLELISLSHRLNAEALTDSHGNKLFAAVLELSPEEIVAHFIEERPLILIYKPRSQKVYHSVAVSGYCPEQNRFYVNDPLRKKPSWIRLLKIPTFENTGKYLILLVGLYESGS